MTKVVAAIALVLSLACPQLVQALETTYFSVDLPDSWELMQQRETGGVTMAIFGTKSRDVLVTTVVSSAGGVELKAIAENFALQYKARRAPQVKNGQASFSYTPYDKGEGQAWLALQDDIYMFTTAEGDLRKAREFIKKMKSEKYPSLIPAP